MADSPVHRTIRRVSRRRFLATTAAGAAAASALGRRLPGGALRGRGATSSASSPAPARMTAVSEHLLVHQGALNVGVIRSGEEALLIDCGDGAVAEALPGLGVAQVTRILFTHYHRDQACGAYPFAAAGATIGVPAAERDYFTNPASYWSDDKNRWRVSRSFRPGPRMLTEPLRVDEALTDGGEFSFGPARIRVLNTPGHTDGAVSYLVEADGERVVFCGDAISGPGQVWDIYSLQRGFSKNGKTIGAYHGFLGDRWRLVESLGRIKQLQPKLLVPSHGDLMNEPAGAIDSLAERLESCYERYVAISALRHYFPQLFTDYAGRPGQMPIRPGFPPPPCLKHFGTTWMLVSQTGAAFVMDVGSPRIVERIGEMLAGGEIQRVEGLWVTHYHNDHTDGIPKFQQEFDCPCIADRRLADVLVRPEAWRLPCLAPEPIRVDRPMEDGQSWRWREFKMTSYFYPGQTLYHAALLVESGQLRMLFIGDSHTMAGIDDYCAYNRNWLGRGVGFQYCLSLIDRLKPTHLFNPHVADAFTFTPEEIRFMRKNLDEREKLFGDLTPWDHANYAMDASWVRCDPYSQRARPGDEVRWKVVVANHSTGPQRASCRVVSPSAFGGKAGAWVEAEIPAKKEGELPATLRVPRRAAAGRYIAPVDVQYGARRLPQFAEAIIDVEEVS